jgi:hypothetical protein
VSGSWPGEIHLFRGVEKGFAASEVLRHAGGKKVNVGRASAPAVADWDADGDLDLLVGDVDGRVHFVPN